MLMMSKVFDIKTTGGFVMNTGGFSIEHLGLIAFGLFLLLSVVLEV